MKNFTLFFILLIFVLNSCISEKFYQNSSKSDNPLRIYYKQEEELILSSDSSFAYYKYFNNISQTFSSTYGTYKENFMFIKITSDLNCKNDYFTVEEDYDSTVIGTKFIIIDNNNSINDYLIKYNNQRKFSNQQLYLKTILDTQRIYLDTNTFFNFSLYEVPLGKLSYQRIIGSYVVLNNKSNVFKISIYPNDIYELYYESKYFLKFFKNRLLFYDENKKRLFLLTKISKPLNLRI